MRRSLPQSGFSLVELSIVLVILGLLTGGILGGQSLIRAAELRRLTNGLATTQTALSTFRDKYFALPGDITNATQFWGIAGGSTGNDDACYTVESTDEKTCNGNGDGNIHMGYTGTGFHERGRAWQHLANAGLVEGKYNGFHGLSADDHRIGGVNTRVALPGANWNLSYNGAADAASTVFYPMSAANFIELSADFTNPAAKTTKTLLAEEAWNLDQKLDDGMPATGKFRSFKAASMPTPNCSVGATSSAVYNLTLKTKACQFLWHLD